MTQRGRQTSVARPDTTLEGKTRWDKIGSGSWRPRKPVGPLSQLTGPNCMPFSRCTYRDVRYRRQNYKPESGRLGLGVQVPCWAEAKARRVKSSMDWIAQRHPSIRTYATRDLFPRLFLFFLFFFQPLICSLVFFWICLGRFQKIRDRKGRGREAFRRP